MSVMKTSGSKRDRLVNGRYADTRNSKQPQDIEHLPSHEAFKSTKKFANGKVNYGLLVRFLRGRVGCPWDEVYSEIISRIPSKLLNYREMIFWFVADKVDKIDGRLWDRSARQFIWMGEPIAPILHPQKGPRKVEFYVDPDSGNLEKVQ